MPYPQISQMDADWDDGYWGLLIDRYRQVGLDACNDELRLANPVKTSRR